MSSEVTVRGLIREMQLEIRDTELQPDRAAWLLNRLTALLGNCADEVREADYQYACCLLGHLEREEKANRARIFAEISPEYQRKREARDTKDLCLELCRALKYYLKAKADERHLT